MRKTQGSCTINMWHLLLILLHVKMTGRLRSLSGLQRPLVSGLKTCKHTCGTAAISIYIPLLLSLHLLELYASSSRLPALPPTAFGFLFNDKCGFSTERLVLSKRRDAVENVAGMAFLLAADRVQTGSYINLDYIIGDTGISQGRWDTECSPFPQL